MTGFPGDPFAAALRAAEEAARRATGIGAAEAEARRAAEEAARRAAAELATRTTAETAIRAAEEAARRAAEDAARRAAEEAARRAAEEARRAAEEAARRAREERTGVLGLEVVTKTPSELARAAIDILNDATREVLQEAINAFKIRNLRPEGLIPHLARRTSIPEVLNRLPDRPFSRNVVSENTVADFAEAVRIDPSRTAAMDAIAAIAILNNPQLDEQILAENLPDVATQDLLDNRVVVDQWPKGGAPLSPPYVILVAVEYRDIARAEDVVRSILGELVEHEGVKLPAAAAQKLSG